MTEEELEARMVELRELLAQAKAEDKWFCANHRSLWFSPREMEAKWEVNKCRWAAETWRLACPEENLRKLNAEIARKVKEYADFYARTKQSESEKDKRG